LLHNNKLDSIHDLQDLAALPKLTILTAYGNTTVTPLQHHRNATVTPLPKLTILTAYGIDCYIVVYY
jgi:hypothetical protein